MTRIKRARPALVVAVLVLIAAVAGTAIAGSGPDANTSASAKKTAKKALKKAKKAKKQAKQNAALLADLCGPGASAAGNATCTAPQGPKGDTGATGATGAPATRLFATVRNDGTLIYGQGATAAQKTSTGVYTVTFNRSLVNCVAIGNAGFGNPLGGSNSFNTRTNVTADLFSLGNANQLRVVTFKADATHVFEDSGFLIAVFC